MQRLKVEYPLIDAEDEFCYEDVSEGTESLTVDTPTEYKT